MRITVSGRHVELSNDLKAYATEKAEKLTRYYDRIHSVEVVFDVEGDNHKVEVIAKADHHTSFVAKHGDHDAYASFDLTMKEIEQQIRRHKDKLRNRVHSGKGFEKQPLGEGPLPGAVPENERPHETH